MSHTWSTGEIDFRVHFSTLMKKQPFDLVFGLGLKFH